MSRERAGDAASAATVAYEDVDDIIGLALERLQAQAERLDVADVEAIAAELGVGAGHVRRATEELRRRRAAAAARRRRLRRIGIGAAAAALLGTIGVALSGVATRNGLVEEASQLDGARAQVRNVLERQERVDSRWSAAPPGTEREAELEGAENRVRIERRRYDEVASRYNARAGAFPASVWCAVFGLPQRVALSSEVERW